MHFNKDLFWSYARETPFHGFGFVARGWGKCEVVSWLLTVVVCVIISIQQTVSLVKVYYGEPTETKTSVNLNKTFTLPNPVLCFNTEYADMITPIPTIWSDQISAIGGIDTLLNQLDNYTAETIYTAPTSIKDLIRLMFLTYADMTFTEVFLLNVDYVQLPIIWQRSASRETHKILLQSNNRTIEDSMRLTASLICKLMNISVVFSYLDRLKTFRDAKVVFNVCQSRLVTHFDDKLICVNILGPNQLITFLGPKDVLRVSFNPNYWNPNIVAKQFSIDFGGRPYYNKLGDGGNVLTADYNVFTKASVQLTAEFNSLNLRRHPCSKDVSQFDCINICAGDIIKEICGCWLLYSFSCKPATVRTCANFIQPNSSNLMPDYHNCVAALKLRDMKPTFAKCVANCMNNCNYKQFMFITEAIATGQVVGQTVMELNIRDFTYTKVDEIVTKDWSSFMNEFGGSLGVWLGGSILALVHLPVYIGKLIFAARKGKPPTTVTPEQLYL